MMNAVSANTRATYNQAWQIFSEFREKLGFDTGRPASLEQVANFIGWLSLSGRAPSTIGAYVAGVGFFHKIKYASDPTAHCVVQQLLKGARREHRQPDSRAAMHGVLFEKFLAVLPRIVSSAYEVLLFKAALALGFFGFMRLGEFTSAGARGASPLAAGDVTVRGSSEVVVSIRKSKNNQCGDAQTLRLPASRAKSRPCPVRILTEFARIRPPNTQAFLCHFDGTSLTRYQFQALI